FDIDVPILMAIFLLNLLDMSFSTYYKIGMHSSIEDAEKIIRHLNPDNVPTTPRSGDIDSYLAPRCQEKAANDALYRNKERIKPFLEEIKKRDCDQFSPDLESIQACID
ncbi:MAG: hypothetical protein AAFY16_01950, partial [Cyanobacteria bacterium J06642_3]